MAEATRYAIDYGWKHGAIISREPVADAAALFGRLGSQCFGLRKSMTKPPMVVSISAAVFPADAAARGATVILLHNGPAFGDEIWWAQRTDGEWWKVMNEWGDLADGGTA